ncbi:GNAT family N-acetyltransferase [Deinococcus lacus]|uniref:GNAT family N-acetyltransferase n=1 Tax=Deinococcus lacus TaxID=392561 RepID=A0ABW1YEB7_9DEIO
MSGFCIRPLGPADAPAYRELRLAALQETPGAFVTTAEDFATRPLEVLAQRLQPSPENVTFGAFIGSAELVGMVILARESGERSRHRAYIFGVAVLQKAQGQGIGRALMETAIAYARELKGLSSLHLDVMEGQIAALELYRSLGFEVWGTDPAAMQVGGRRVAAHAMWLAL